jgi:hypothetical protein
MLDPMSDPLDGPRLYDDLADWFHLLTAPADYADEAEFIHDLLAARAQGPLETMLELGSGGGNIASHLKHDLRLTLTDVALPMLEISQHLRPGGLAVFSPDCVAETFEPGTSHGGHDGPDRGMRYLEWTTDPDPIDTTYLSDFAMLLRREDGAVEVRRDRHVMGLFPRRTWLDSMTAVGFEADVLDDRWQRDVFVGRRPAVD